jgi:hypothetical protein
MSKVIKTIERSSLSIIAISSLSECAGASGLQQDSREPEVRDQIIHHPILFTP